MKILYIIKIRVDFSASEESTIKIYQSWNKNMKLVGILVVTLIMNLLSRTPDV